jgi:hypothetical protein
MVDDYVREARADRKDAVSYINRDYFHTERLQTGRMQLSDGFGWYGHNIYVRKTY